MNLKSPDQQQFDSSVLRNDVKTVLSELRESGLKFELDKGENLSNEDKKKRRLLEEQGCIFIQNSKKEQPILDEDKVTKLVKPEGE
jgi:hypothetical protein